MTKGEGKTACQEDERGVKSDFNPRAKGDDADDKELNPHDEAKMAWQRDIPQTVDRLFTRFGLHYGNAWGSQLKNPAWTAALKIEWQGALRQMTRAEVQQSMNWLGSRDNTLYVTFPPSALQFLQLPQRIGVPKTPTATVRLVAKPKPKPPCVAAIQERAKVLIAMPGVLTALRNLTNPTNKREFCRLLLRKCEETGVIEKAVKNVKNRGNKNNEARH